MQVTGSCHCGFITLKAEVDPEKVVVCHCTDCQTVSSSAFRVSVPVPGNSFEITGEPAIYVKTTAASGKPRVQAFCPKCGTALYATTVGEGKQETYALRLGVIRERDQLSPKRQIWFRSVRPWLAELVSLPKAAQQS